MSPLHNILLLTVHISPWTGKVSKLLTGLKEAICHCCNHTTEGGAWKHVREQFLKITSQEAQACHQQAPALVESSNYKVYCIQKGIDASHTPGARMVCSAFYSIKAIVNQVGALHLMVLTGLWGLTVKGTMP